METTHGNKEEFFNEIPPYILESLHKFLNSTNDYQALKNQLGRTGIVIEKDEYQISIPTIKKLDEIVRFLNEEYESP